MKIFQRCKLEWLFSYSASNRASLLRMDAIRTVNIFHFTSLLFMETKLDFTYIVNLGCSRVDFF